MKCETGRHNIDVWSNNELHTLWLEVTFDRDRMGQTNPVTKCKFLWLEVCWFVIYQVFQNHPSYDWTLALSIFYLDTFPVFDQSTFGSEVFENNLIADNLWKWGQGKTSGNSYHIREAQSVDDITLKVIEIVLTSA